MNTRKNGAGDRRDHHGRAAAGWLLGDLASATHELRRALVAGREIDYARALELWLELGSDLLHHGADRITALEGEARAAKLRRSKVTR